ncbi:uncharacterized protein B0I36DRAFT_320182 [Microdochium trichocladiopsis]|uniref:Uncharacterized protein n=1 Tax=Microdochium trichocladiopsis TaxID=1682393 RepID=A0A9P9BV17_9PEZI|nr:uncharacterized protein B0I36DRAFT_320182 [Microdochium trichocladiopsis]KAH7032862.1 hypothetical protein B0I36DRAFT_320182 [Microdochium trichocladiopsis]
MIRRRLQPAINQPLPRSASGGYFYQLSLHPFGRQFPRSLGVFVSNSTVRRPAIPNSAHEDGLLWGLSSFRNWSAPSPSTAPHRSVPRRQRNRNKNRLRGRLLVRGWVSSRPAAVSERKRGEEKANLVLLAFPASNDQACHGRCAWQCQPGNKGQDPW